jgi:glycerophosphoryl diester phosphodiesterase
MMRPLLRSINHRVLVESHRGAESLAPANSLRALQVGHQCGANWLETDVQLSTDGVAFLHHNYSLPDSRRCRDVTWAELSRVTLEGEAIPRLDDVLAWARDADAQLSLDLKTAFIPEGKLTAEVLRVIERTQTADRVMLIAWDHCELVRAKDAHPEIKTRALIRARLVDLPAALQAARVDCVSLSYDLIRPSEVEQAHALGIAITLVGMWQPDFDFVTRSGVDMVSWGDPAEAKRRLDSR